MSFPIYVKSIVKYKSPHPQDLSFPKDEVIRVLGYVEREVADDDEEEDDRWYMGEWLDGSRRGQFPASLVTRVEPPLSAPMPTNASSSGVSDVAAMAAPPVVAVPSTNSASKHSSEPVSTSTNVTSIPEAQPTSLQPGLDAREAENGVQGEGFSERAQEAEAVQPGSAAVDPAISTASEVENSSHSIPAPAPIPVPEPVAELKPMGGDEEQKALKMQRKEAEKIREEEDKHVEKAKQEEGNEKQQTNTESVVAAPVNEPPEDPSKLSLRERIAAFNKPIEKTPPPIPRSKPGGWKRPPPAEGAAKPPMPVQTPIPAQALATASSDSVPSPATVDARTDSSSSTFNASDAKSSIKMSLKERMAALQRKDGGEQPPQIERQAPSKLKNPLAETHAEAGEDAERRAAIARRMAALGGRRVEPGLFGQAPKDPSTQAPGEVLDEAPVESTDLQQEAPSQIAPQDEAAPLSVPRRAAAPRTRRTRPVEPKDEVQVPAQDSMPNAPLTAEPADMAPQDLTDTASIESVAADSRSASMRQDSLMQAEQDHEAMAQTTLTAAEPDTPNEQVLMKEGSLGEVPTQAGRDVPSQEGVPVERSMAENLANSSEQASYTASSERGKAANDALFDPNTDPVPGVAGSLGSEEIPSDVYGAMEAVPVQETVPMDQSSVVLPNPMDRMNEGMANMTTQDAPATEEDFEEQRVLLENLLHEHSGSDPMPSRVQEEVHQQSPVSQEPKTSQGLAPPEPQALTVDTAMPAPSSRFAGMGPPPIMGMPMPRRQRTTEASPVSPEAQESFVLSPTHAEIDHQRTESVSAQEENPPPRPTRRAPTLPGSEEASPISPPTTHDTRSAQSPLSSKFPLSPPPSMVPPGHDALKSSDIVDIPSTTPAGTTVVPNRPMRAPPRAPPRPPDLA